MTTPFGEYQKAVKDSDYGRAAIALKKVMEGRVIPKALQDILEGIRKDCKNERQALNDSMSDMYKDLQML